MGESIFPLPNRSYSNAIAPLMTGQQDIYADAEARHWDSGSQVAAMEKEGIARAVLFPSRGLFTLGAAGMAAADDHPDLTLEPSAYCRRQCDLSVECDETPAAIVSQYGLEDNGVFSTDYPHADSKYPQAVERFLTLPLSSQAKRKFLWDNCAKLYGFDA